MSLIYRLTKNIKILLMLLIVFLYEIFYVWMINNTIEYTVDKHVKLIFKNGIKTEFIFLVLIMIALTSIRQILTYLVKLYNKNLSTKLRSSVYSSMTEYAFKDNLTKDKLYALISDNLENVISIFDDYTNYLLVIAASLGSAAYIVTLDIRIVIILSAIGLLLLTYSFIFKGKLYKKEETLLEKSKDFKEYNNYMYETVLDRSKYSNTKFEKEYESKFEKYRLEFKDANLSNLKYMFIPYMLGFAQTYLPLLIIYFWKIDIILGELMALLLTITSFMGIFRNTVEFIADTEKKKAAFNSIKIFLNKNVDLITEQHFETQKNSLEIKNLKLKLPHHELCISDINICNNGLYKISGEKGIGKTTLFKAMLGDENIKYSGKIMLNDIDIKECSIKYISKYISYMQQNSPIIDGTIKTVFNNINYSLEESQMINILKSVAISPDDFQSNDYNDLLETFIEQDKISEGQRQRLSLAYTLAMGKNILLLDEPTSHLDFATKEIVINTLNKLSKDKIILIISHDDKLISKNNFTLKLTKI